MTGHVLRFCDVEWNQVGEFARQKQLSTDEQLVRLLELAPGFSEPDWCNRGHVGYVIEGTLQIEFPDRTESFSAGDGLVVVAGQKHRALETQEQVKLFLVDEV